MLNIWAPANAEQRLPVMVWLHGGGFQYGSSGVLMYDGTNLADRGQVVVVSVNHRLNVFGYVWFGDLVPELEHHANPGQRDIELALRWVRDNIAFFGGDPGNVTVFGESGGGGKIAALCASPTAQGLFQKMVIQSGVPSHLPDRSSATESTRALLAELGIPQPTVDALQRVSAQDLKAAETAVEARLGPIAFRPVIDGRHITDQLWSERVLEAVDDVPLLIGITSDETIAFGPELGKDRQTDAEMITDLESFSLTPHLKDREWRHLVEEYRRLLPDVTGVALATAIASDLTFMPAAQLILTARIGTAAPTFAYEFAWRTPCFGSSWSPHGGEIPFVFGNLRYPTAWDGQDTDAQRVEADPIGNRFALSDFMIDAWSNFARTGQPSLSPTSWPPSRGAGGCAMILGGPRPHVETSFRSERWDLVRDLPRPW